MMIKIESVYIDKIIKEIKLYGLFVLLLVGMPAIYAFEMCIVFPVLVEEWSVAYFVHLFNIHFILLNALGNIIFGMYTNTSVKGRKLKRYVQPDWSYCTVCECPQPPRAWHCSFCDVCILRRDHHCWYFACCIGYFNHRYFMCFLFYALFTFVYALYYNLQFMYRFIKFNHGLVALKFIFPLASLMVDFSSETIYIIIIHINLFAAVFAGLIFHMHVKNIFNGRVVHVNNANDKEIIHEKNWKANIKEIFGEYWYLTWILPFIRSPLPGNGIEWHTYDKQR